MFVKRINTHRFYALVPGNIPLLRLNELTNSVDLTAMKSITNSVS